MDSSLIMPFVASAQAVFQTMMQVRAEVGEPYVNTDRAGGHEVFAIIGMTGDVNGSVTLTFPRTTASRVASVFGGAEVGFDSPDFIDALGEVVNMVAGGAKAKFAGRNVSISCPSVVIGDAVSLRHGSDHKSIVIPFTSDLGDFNIEVATKPTACAQAAA
jgi:chemotaxis protein CheX